MNEQAMRFRFGIFVLGSLILLAVLTILFGGFPNYFSRSEEYTIKFSNGTGIAPGTPVRRSGVRIGEVRSVTLDNVSGEVLVKVRVDEKYYPHKSDRPTIVQGLLGGDASIAFLPPDDKEKIDPAPVPPGSVLQGHTPLDPGSLVQRTSDLIQPANEALIEMRKVLQSINKMTPMMEETLKDFRELSQTANKMAPDFQRTSEEFRALSKSARDLMPELKRTNEEAQVTLRTWGKVGERTDVLLKINEDKITRSIDQVETALKRINDVFSPENQKNLQDTLRNVRNSSQQFEAITRDTGELIKDSRVTVRQVSETMKRADAALEDVQRALRPFSGDKGSPFFKNLDDTTAMLNLTLKDVRELIQIIGRSEGTVQKLITDPALYNNLNDSAAMVTKILPRLDQVLRDVEIFADKLARHPELLGVGGALRPSTGLKEAPSTVPYRIFPRP